MNVMMGLHMGGVTRAAGQGGNPPGDTATFGALTLSGAGGVDLPSGATSITNAGGTNLTVSGGKVVPVSNGVSAGTATFNNGATMAVTATADEYSALTAAEVSAAATAAGSNKTVRIRAAAQAIQITLPDMAKTGMVVTGESGHSIDELSMGAVSGITFSGLNIENDNSAGAPWNASTNAAISVGVSTVTFDDCDINCGPAETEGDTEYRPMSVQYQRFGGFSISAGATAIANNCRIRRVRDGINANDVNLTVTNCDFRELTEDAITGLRPSPWVITGNTATVFEGRPGKRYRGTITGTLTVGTILTNGQTGISKRMIEVVAVGADYVDGHYNNWQIPDTVTYAPEGEWPSPTNTIAVTSIDGNPITGYDGIHGDFVQPLGNNSDAAHAVTVHNNMVLREQPHELNTIGREQNPQPFLIQGHASFTGNWENLSVHGNVASGGQPIGLRLASVLGGTVTCNTILDAEYGETVEIETFHDENLLLYRNAGQVSQTENNQNVAELENIDLADWTTQFPNLYTYPQTKASFTPGVGGSIEAGGIGALDSSGNFRAQPTLPTPALSALSATATGPTSADFSLTPSHAAGQIPMAAYPTGETRTKAEIKAGTGAIWSGQTTNLGTTALTPQAWGMAAATAYEMHAYFELGSVEGSISKTAVTTLAADQTALPSMMEDAPVIGASPLAFTAQDNANSAVIVFVTTSGINASHSVTCAWGGEDMTLIGSTSGIYEKVTAFIIKKADMPSGETGNIVATPSTAAPTLSVQAFTVRDVDQAATGFNVQVSGTETGSITPSNADSAVFAVGVSANQAYTGRFDGMSNVANHYDGATSTLVAQRQHDDTTFNVALIDGEGRQGIVMFALPPASVVVPAAGPTVVAGSLIESALGVNVGALTQPGYTAGAGSNRKVIVAVHQAQAGGSRLVWDRTVEWGGEPMREVAVQGEANTTFGYEIVGFYEIAEADFPAGATGDIVTTMASGTVYVQCLTVWTVQDTAQTDIATQASNNANTIAITPAVADSLVFAAYTSGDNDVTDETWAAGLSKLSFKDTTTSCLAIGSASGVPASALTCTANEVGTREAILAISMAPVP